MNTAVGFWNRVGMKKSGGSVGKAGGKREIMPRGGRTGEKVEMVKRGPREYTASEKWEIMQRGGKPSEKVEVKKRGESNEKDGDEGEMKKRGPDDEEDGDNGKMKKRGRNDETDSDSEDEMDIRSIMKKIELLGSEHMTWKEKKALENRKVIELGGKPQKKQRLPLSVAKVPMKKQKEKERKMLLENQLYEKYEGIAKITKKKDKRKGPERKGLRPTEGHFRNGVLDVKDLLKSGGPSSDRIPGRIDINIGGQGRDGGKRKGGGGKKKGKGGKKKGKGGKWR